MTYIYIYIFYLYRYVRWRWLLFSIDLFPSWKTRICLISEGQGQVSDFAFQSCTLILSLIHGLIFLFVGQDHVKWLMIWECLIFLLTPPIARISSKTLRHFSALHRLLPQVVDWNRKHPDIEILVFDRIVAVNGQMASGNLKKTVRLWTGNVQWLVED